MGNYVWKSELIFPSDKWNCSKLTESIAVKPVQTTTSVRQPLVYDDQSWVRPNEFPYNLYYCIRRPRDQRPLFFVSQMKKSLSKTITKKTCSSKEMGNKHKEQCTKNKRLSLSLCLYLLYCYSLMLSLFNVYKGWAIYEII